MAWAEAELHTLFELDADERRLNRRDKLALLRDARGMRGELYDALEGLRVQANVCDHPDLDARRFALDDDDALRERAETIGRALSEVRAGRGARRARPGA